MVTIARGICRKILEKSAINKHLHVFIKKLGSRSGVGLVKFESAYKIFLKKHVLLTHLRSQPGLFDWPDFRKKNLRSDYDSEILYSALSRDNLSC